MSELKHGWLSPTGEFIECKCWEHYETADKIYKQVFHVDDIPFVRIFGEEDALYEIGWIKISRSAFGMREWCFYGYKIWSAEQYNFLKPYIDTNNLSFGSKCLVEKYEDGYN